MYVDLDHLLCVRERESGLMPAPTEALTHSRCLWSARELFLARRASAECHKYFPLFRNGSEFVAGRNEGETEEEERGTDRERRNRKAVKRRKVDEESDD